MHIVKCFQVLLCFNNNSIKHQPFVYTQLNDQTVLFQVIQFSISHLFALSLNVKVHSLNVKQFYLTPSPKKEYPGYDTEDEAPIKKFGECVVLFHCYFSQIHSDLIAQSAGAVEYTDCTSAEE